MAEDQDVTQMAKEFVAALMVYLKQRGNELVTAVLVEPLRKMALKAGLGCAGLIFLGLGVVFFGIFMVLGFTWLFGNNPIWGYLASAVLVMGVGGILLWLMSRPAAEEAKDGQASVRTDDNG